MQFLFLYGFHIHRDYERNTENMHENFYVETCNVATIQIFGVVSDILNVYRICM
jgi:hypothetical protein